MNDIRKYEGSHVFIFDSVDKPNRIVLVYNPKIGHVATPGFGRRGDMNFEEATKAYTEKQTGLIVDDLELLEEWDNDGKPFLEPDGTLQFVKVRNYLARRVNPEDIEKRIEEYGKTENGRDYKPSFVEILRLNEVNNLAEDVPELMKKHFNLDI
jgi:hypothetical protein